MPEGSCLPAAELVSTYLRAKDFNRPHLMSAAFAPDATLEMVVNAGTIAFPPRAAGVDAITEVLVRRFGQTFENVYTFCLVSPPAADVPAFSCAWLVAMSEKASGAVRVGAGRYDWAFRADRSTRAVERLKITIDHMLVLPAAELGTVMDWIASLPYPWCPAEVARQGMPRSSGLESIAGYLRNASRASAA